MSRFGDEGRMANGKQGIRLNFWLVVGRGDGGRPSVRIVASYPTLARNERALYLKIELPIALFEAPTITASITVDAPETPVNIDATAVAEAVRQAIGMDVDIRIGDGS